MSRMTKNSISASSSSSAATFTRTLSPALVGKITQLYTLFQNEMTTMSTWPGFALPKHTITAKFNEFKASGDHRKEINDIGEHSGCHSCGSDIRTDTNQPWIGDHQPPTGLTPAARAVLKLPLEPKYNGDVTLLPQCDICASIQSALVTQVNNKVAAKEDLPSLSSHQSLLLGVTQTSTRYSGVIYATSDKVNSTQGNLIQAEGVANGCHSCGERRPKHTYHADHFPPVCYTYSHITTILMYAKQNIGSMAGITIYDSFQYRPQCPRCSHAQGGNTSAILNLAREIAIEMGIPVLN